MAYKRKTLLILLTILLSILQGCSGGNSSDSPSSAKKQNNQEINSPSPTTSTQKSQNADKISNDPLYKQSNTLKTGLVISEFMAANVNTKMDPDFHQFSDWIELYNNSNKPINIKGYQISNTKDQQGWEMPSATIPSKKFIILWADKENKGLHTNFSLDSHGDSIYLYDQNGKMIDSVVFGKQKADISAGRNLKSFEWGYMLPSFDKDNMVTVPKERSKKPIFSAESGFYNQSITVTFQGTDNEEIYYTTDGSIPSKKAQKYTAAIPIDHTSVIRAISYKTNLLPSKIVSKTYFINERTMKTSPLPVVSLSINSDYLFDNNYGIYIEGNKTPSSGSMHCEGRVSDEYNYAQGWKRPANIEYFDKSEQPLNFHLRADISISGECSRQYPKRSLSFKLKKKYGEKELNYKLYPQKDIHKIRDFKLRTGGNGYRLSDILSANLVADGKLDIDYQAFRIVHVYVNGEYWGIYHIREKKGKNFIKSNYPDVDEDNLDIISVEEVKEGDKTDYNQIRYFVNHNDLSLETNYQEVLKKIDIDNFIDYMSFMIFCGAQDWISNNTRLWKEKKDGAKWRWILDDVDGGLQAWALSHNNFQRIADKPNYFTSELFTALSKNINFKNRFKQRLIHLMDTVFQSQNIIKYIHQIVDQEKNYMQYEKWAKELSRNEKTVEGFKQEFTKHIQSMIDFANQRKSIVVRQLNNY